MQRAAALACSASVAVGDVAAEGRLRLAELAAIAVERLLALGRSLVAHFRTGRPADDGILWPDASKAKAALLRSQAQRMLAALESLGSAYAAAAAARTQTGASALAGAPAGDAGGIGTPGGADVDKNVPAGGGAGGGDGPAAQAGLQADARAAAAHLGDALRGLLYVVLLSSQDHGKVYG